jgi:hypothetical protein
MGRDRNGPSAGVGDSMLLAPPDILLAENVHALVAPHEGLVDGISEQRDYPNLPDEHGQPHSRTPTSIDWYQYHD